MFKTTYPASSNQIEVTTRRQTQNPCQGGEAKPAPPAAARTTIPHKDGHPLTGGLALRRNASPLPVQVPPGTPQKAPGSATSAPGSARKRTASDCHVKTIAGLAIQHGLNELLRRLSSDYNCPIPKDLDSESAVKFIYEPKSNQSTEKDWAFRYRDYQRREKNTRERYKTIQELRDQLPDIQDKGLATRGSILSNIAASHYLVAHSNIYHALKISTSPVLSDDDKTKLYQNLLSASDNMARAILTNCAYDLEITDSDSIDKLRDETCYLAAALQMGLSALRYLKICLEEQQEDNQDIKTQLNSNLAEYLKERGYLESALEIISNRVTTLRKHACKKALDKDIAPFIDMRLDALALIYEPAKSGRNTCATFKTFAAELKTEHRADSAIAKLRAITELDGVTLQKTANRLATAQPTPRFAAIAQEPNAQTAPEARTPAKRRKKDGSSSPSSHASAVTAGTTDDHRAKATAAFVAALPPPPALEAAQPPVPSFAELQRKIKSRIAPVFLVLMQNDTTLTGYINSLFLSLLAGGVEQGDAFQQVFSYYLNYPVNMMRKPDNTIRLKDCAYQLLAHLTDNQLILDERCIVKIIEKIEAYEDKDCLLPPLVQAGAVAPLPSTMPPQAPPDAQRPAAEKATSAFNTTGLFAGHPIGSAGSPKPKGP